MSEWQIHLPYRSRSDTLADVAEAARELPTDDDRAVVRQIVLGEIVGGSAATAGELLDQIEKATPEQRRKMLDAARVKAGLPTTATVEGIRTSEMASAAGAMRAAKESPWQLCPAAGCNAAPLDPHTGILAPSTVRRWWCPAHEHLAADGDLEPRRPTLVLGPSGGFVDLAEQEAEAARDAAESESRRRQHEEKLASRQAEAAVNAEHKRARDEAFRSELPPGFPA